VCVTRKHHLFILLIYIKYASSQQTLTEISDTYGVCEGTAHCIIHRTSSLICADMLPNLITWLKLLSHGLTLAIHKKHQENANYNHILLAVQWMGISFD
jgi:hypothetical protein